METKYQIVATNAKAMIKVGEPYDGMALAELRADELRYMLRLVPKGSEVLITVEPVTV